MSGLHGNEKTGQLVIAELLKRPLNFKGTLTILPIANPTGFAKDTREEAISGLDLNRQFLDTETEEDDPASVATRAIGEIAKQHDYVIDLHNFSTAGLIQALSNHIGNSDRLASLFAPEVIRTSPKETGLKLTGTLARYLKNLGVPYVLIEMPVHTKATSEQIGRIVSGLLKHLSQCVKYEQLKTDAFDKIPKVVIRKVQPDREGTFTKNATLSLGDRVEKGQALGTIRDSVEGSTSIVPCPYSGIVCEMNDYTEREVRAGDVLLRVGETV